MIADFFIRWYGTKSVITQLPTQQNTYEHVITLLKIREIECKWVMHCHALRHCLSVIVAKFASIKNTELSNHSYNIVRPLDPAETRAVTSLHLCNNGARFYISKNFIFLMIHCACTKLSNALRQQNFLSMFRNVLT